MMEAYLLLAVVKDMIIVNGRNHWPQDIEWAAEQLPGIRNGDIAAVSLPGDKDERSSCCSCPLPLEG